MCNVTHFLLVIGKGVKENAFAMSLTSCWSEENMWEDCLSQNMQCCLQTAMEHRKTCYEIAIQHVQCAMSLTRCWSEEMILWDAFHATCNVTHSLLVIGKLLWDSIVLTCNVTHSLLVIGKNVMRLAFTKSTMSLTSCWSLEKMSWNFLSKTITHLLWVIGKEVMRLCLSHNLQCHSQATWVIGKAVMRMLFAQCAMSCHSLAVGDIY